MRIKYASYYRLRLVLAGALVLYAIYAIWAFASGDPSMVQDKKATGWAIFSVVFWTLGPPVWFFLEYFWAENDMIDISEEIKAEGVDRESFLRTMRDYSSLAKPIWAAVLATILFMFPKPVKAPTPAEEQATEPITAFTAPCHTPEASGDEWGAVHPWPAHI